MKNLIPLLTVIAFSTAAVRAADHALTGENTTVKFTGTKKDGKHDGAFPKVEGKLALDSADVSKSKLEVTLDVNAMTTDSEKLTSHLKSPDFFDAAKHPTAKFVSTSIKPGDEKGTYTISGNLTMLGKTHAVTFPAKVAEADGTSTVTGQFEIDRNNWGMTYGKGKVDAAVKISLEVKLKTK